MAISLRPAMRSGLITASAAAVVFGAVSVPPAFRSESPPPVAVANVDLTASSQPIPPAPDLSALAALTPGQVFDAGQAVSAVVTPTLVTTPGLVNLANFIDNAYNAIEPWVAYAVSLAAYAVSWVPYIGWIIDDQIWVVYNFVESLINSGVFNVTDWMRGEGTFAKNLADWVVDLGLALVWLGIDEIGAWIPLPPINYPPRPPWADLPEGVFGDTIVNASEALARVSNRIWDVWEPIKGGVDNGVAWLSGVLDRFDRVPFVPLINVELNATWQLIAAGGDALTGFAHDMINAGNQFIIDSINGGGLIAATAAAFTTTLDSIAARGGQAVQAFVDWGRAQVDFIVDLVTPGSAAPPVVATAAAAGPVVDEEPAVVQFDGDDSEQSLRTSRVTEVDVQQGFLSVGDRPRSLEDFGDAEIADVESPEDVDVSLEDDVSAEDGPAEDEPGLESAEDEQDATDRDEAKSDEPESDAPADAGAANTPAGL